MHSWVLSIDKRQVDDVSDVILSPWIERQGQRFTAYEILWPIIAWLDKFPSEYFITSEVQKCIPLPQLIINAEYPFYNQRHLNLSSDLKQLE